MNPAEGQKEGGNPYLINHYSKPMSRLNKNWLNNTPARNTTATQGKVDPPNTDNPAKKEEVGREYKNLMPKKVSELSPSVIFQDADKLVSEDVQKKQNQTESGNQQEGQNPLKKGAMGLLSNAFMGATTRFQKTGTDYKVSTPNKNLEDVQSPTYKKSESGSQASANKFARRKEAQLEVKVQTLNLNIQSEVNKDKSPRTDRSSTEGGKRIARKQDRGKHNLKFMEKKETGQSEVNQQLGNGGESKLTKQTGSIITQPVVEPPIVPAVPINKPYRPYQRQNLIENKPKISVEPVNIVPPSPEAKQQQPQVKQQVPQVKLQPIQRRPYQSRANSPPVEQTLIVSQEVKQQQISSPPKSPAVKSRVIPTQQVKVNVIEKIDEVLGNKRYPPRKSDRQMVTPSSSKAVSPVKDVQNSLESSGVAEKVILKKSVSIAFIIKRLISNKVVNVFDVLKRFASCRKVHLTSEAAFLISASEKIVGWKERNLMQLGFDQLRRKFTPLYIQSIKPMLTAPLSNPQKTLCILIENLFRSKLRAVLGRLTSKLQINSKIKSLLALEHLLKVKQLPLKRETFEKIKVKSKCKVWLWNQLGKILTVSAKQQLMSGFQKLLSWNLKEGRATQVPKQKPPTRSFLVRQKPALVQESVVVESVQPNPVLVDKEQKLKAINISITESISLLEGNLEQSRRENEYVFEQFNSRISILTREKQQLQKELSSKKNVNQQLTKELTATPNKVRSKSVEEQLETFDNKLQRITNIYINNFKNAQESVNAQDIASQFLVEVNDANSVVNEWTMMEKNIELKREVASYEQAFVQESKARRTILEEQHMVLRLVRSYLKEQYFWQWLHVSVEGL